MKGVPVMFIGWVFGALTLVAIVALVQAAYPNLTSPRARREKRRGPLPQPCPHDPSLRKIDDTGEWCGRCGDTTNGWPMEAAG